MVRPSEQCLRVGFCIEEGCRRAQVEVHSIGDGDLLEIPDDGSADEAGKDSDGAASSLARMLDAESERGEDEGEGMPSSNFSLLRLFAYVFVTIGSSMPTGLGLVGFCRSTANQHH